MFKILDGRSQFYQWDLDRKVIVEDASVNEVHFCNRTDDVSLVCEVYELDGKRVADVPNILLQEDWRINVYAYDSNYTKYADVFEVVRRSKPADYVYTETEIKNYDDLYERVEQIEKNGVSDEAVSSAVGKYLEENDIQVDLTGYATEAYVNEKIETIELTPGPEGKPGKDGSDYVLTEADKQEIAGMVEVEGGSTDLSDYYTKSEVDAAINEIELTPGPQGEPGKDGENYILTDEDKAEIAGMVEVSGGESSCLLSPGAGENSIMTPWGSAAATGQMSIGLGRSAQATAMRSVAIGNNASASGAFSTAIGYFVNADTSYQTVIGKQNISDPDALVIIGTDKQNGAVFYPTDNEAYFPGKVTVGANREEVATKAYVDNHVSTGDGGSVNLSNYYTKTETDTAIQTALTTAFADIKMAEEGAY